MPALPVAAGPLGALAPEEQERVRRALKAGLPDDTAAEVLRALERSPRAVIRLPYPTQERALRLILAALPPGVGAVVVSKLGIGLKSDAAYLADVLTPRERADRGFRQRVAAEAADRGIPQWLVATRLRTQGQGIDQVAKRQHARLKAPALPGLDPGGNGFDPLLIVLCLVLVLVLVTWKGRVRQRDDAAAPTFKRAA